MGLPVLVFAPIGPPQIAEYGSFEPPKIFEGAHEAIGVLWSGLVDTGDERRLRAEVERYGATLDTIVRVSSDRDGYVEAHASFRVLAPSVAVARSIPGYLPLYWSGGPQYLPLMEMDTLTAERISGSRNVEKFSFPKNTPLPDYEADGAAAFSRIPQGQLAWVVMLRDQPSAWFAVFGGLSRQEAVDAAKEFS